MLSQAARGPLFRTFCVKCLVDGVQFGRPRGRRTQKAAISRAGARTRQQNDQQFLEITHWRRKRPPRHVTTAAGHTPRTHSRPKWPPTLPVSGIVYDIRKMIYRHAQYQIAQWCYIPGIILFRKKDRRPGGIQQRTFGATLGPHGRTPRRKRAAKSSRRDKRPLRVIRHHTQGAPSS